RLVVDQIVVGDDARALPLDQRAAGVVVGRAQRAVNRRGIQGIEKDHLAEAVAGKNLLPELDRPFEPGRHRKRRVLGRRARRGKGQERRQSQRRETFVDDEFQKQPCNGGGSARIRDRLAGGGLPVRLLEPATAQGPCKSLRDGNTSEPPKI